MDNFGSFWGTSVETSSSLVDNVFGTTSAVADASYEATTAAANDTLEFTSGLVDTGFQVHSDLEALQSNLISQIGIMINPFVINHRLAQQFTLANLDYALAIFEQTRTRLNGRDKNSTLRRLVALKEEVEELTGEIKSAGYCTNEDQLDQVNSIIQELRSLRASHNDTSTQSLSIPMLMALSNVLSTSPEDTTLLPDFGLGHECLKLGLSLISSGHEAESLILSQCGNLFFNRFKRLGKSEDIESALEYHSKGLKAMREDHEKRYLLLGSLGSAYIARFERNQRMGDLSTGIKFHNQAVEGVLGNPNECGNFALLFEGLARAHQCRIEHIGGIVEIEDALSHLKGLVTVSTLGFSNVKATLAGVVGGAYLARFELGFPADLERAITFLTASAVLLPKGHQSVPSTLCTLARALNDRASRENAPSDIEYATRFLELAQSLTPSDHPLQAQILSNRGRSFEIQFEIESNPNQSHLIEAIKLYTQAASLVPPKLRAWVRLMKVLGLCFLRCFKRFGGRWYLDRSLEYLIIAAKTETGHLLDRFQAASAWAHNAFSAEADPQLTLLGYATSLELVPRLVCFGTTPEQQYKATQKAGRLAVEAAAVAIKPGEYGSAIMWLEQGRSVVWNQMYQLRTPLDELSASNPLLAQKLRELSENLQLEDATSSTASLHKSARVKAELAEKYNDTLAEVRKLPGFNDFMRPKSIWELCQATRCGPVVIINMHEPNAPSDALIMVPGHEVYHLRLNGLSGDHARDLREKLETALQSPQSSGISIWEVLSDLWYNVVMPILDCLGYMECRRGAMDPELPSITWCPTGALSQLPLHAAGDYSDGSEEQVFNYAVSSYTPTLEALLSASRGTRKRDQHALLVGHDLGGAMSEIKSVQKLARQANWPICKALGGSEATVQQVLAEMQQNDWVHLACHAMQAAEPAESGFYLDGGVLTLKDIAHEYFESKGLAFLSACSTAQGDKNLPDESVHLAAGMLMAGYSNVIATMWKVSDNVAPFVAGRVYHKLLVEDEMDCALSARALHLATAELRENVEYKNRPDLWVPFIHFGPNTPMASPNEE